jgi:hypothetical protein
MTLCAVLDTAFVEHQMSLADEGPMALMLWLNG